MKSISKKKIIFINFANRSFESEPSEQNFLSLIVFSKLYVFIQAPFKTLLDNIPERYHDFHRK